MLNTTKLYSLIDLDFNSRSQLYVKAETSWLIFLQISLLMWIKFSMLPKLDDLLNSLHLISIQRKNCLGDFTDYAFNIRLHSSTYVLLAFKLCMMLNKTKIAFKLCVMLHKNKLYSLIPVWMTITFTQYHWSTRKLEFEQSFCFEVAWSQNFCDGWLWKEDDCK